MTSSLLRDAMRELLFRHMAAHVARGFTQDEALVLGVQEIKHQIRGSRADLAAMMLDYAVDAAQSALDENTVH